MRRTLATLALLALAGCASSARVAQLEARVAALEADKPVFDRDVYSQRSPKGR